MIDLTGLIGIAVAKANDAWTITGATICNGDASAYSTNASGVISTGNRVHGDIVIKNSTLKSGKAYYAGDIVWNAGGPITLENCVILNDTGTNSVFYGQAITCTGCTITGNSTATRAYIGYFTGGGTETFTNCTFKRLNTADLNGTLFAIYNSQVCNFAGTTDMCGGIIGVNSIGGVSTPQLAISGLFKTSARTDVVGGGTVTFISGSTIKRVQNNHYVVKATSNGVLVIEDNVKLITVAGATVDVEAGTYTDKALGDDGIIVSAS